MNRVGSVVDSVAVGIIVRVTVMGSRTVKSSDFISSKGVIVEELPLNKVAK